MCPRGIGTAADGMVAGQPVPYNQPVVFSTPTWAGSRVHALSVTLFARTKMAFRPSAVPPKGIWATHSTRTVTRDRHSLGQGVEKKCW